MGLIAAFAHILVLLLSLCSVHIKRVFCSVPTEDGFLKTFIESTKSLSPDERGAKLESDEVKEFSKLMYFLTLHQYYPACSSVDWNLRHFSETT